MKENIHPNYYKTKVVCTSCGSEFETGSTLRENGLEVLEEIHPISARMIVNRVSMNMESKRINNLIKDIKEVLNDKNGAI